VLNKPILTSPHQRFDNVRQHPSTNGHTTEPISEFNEPIPEDSQRPSTPPADFTVAREESHEEPLVDVPFDNVTVQPPPAPSPPAIPGPDLPPVSDSPPNADIVAKYKEAQAEIERLRTVIATLPSSTPTELRRRTRALSDDGSTPETDVATMTEEGALQQEGVPLQVVVIIALGVFITTYLFF